MSEGGAFTCSQCGKGFSVSPAALAKYPGWVPKTCMGCKKGRSKSGGGRRSGGAGTRRASVEENLRPEEVLAKYHDGPKTGLFTDGSANPNPGPGGWGAVYVLDDQIVEERHGHEPKTTNNRMELMALIEAYRMAPSDRALPVYSDSQLCVRTVNEWAKGWAARGWKRKSGPIKNLELVQALYALAQEKPLLELQWIKAHDGSRWNEYADALSTVYTHRGA